MKQAIFFLLLVTMSCVTYAQDVYQLSSHILDITSGKPASGVRIALSKMNPDSTWQQVDERRTDRNGRVSDFLKISDTAHNGIYKLTFYTKPYFEALRQPTFYPFIEVIFELSGDAHYHVPITVSPYGYATYRGS